VVVVRNGLAWPASPFCFSSRRAWSSNDTCVVEQRYVRGRSTRRGGFACETWRVRVRDVAGSRARRGGFACRSPGYRVDLFVHIAPSRAGARVVRRWCTCWVCVVTPPCTTGRCAGSPWSSYHGRRHPVRDRSGWCRRWPRVRGAHGLDVPAAAIGCGIDGLCTLPSRPVHVPSCASGGGRGPLWTLPDVAMDLVRRHLGHCRPWLWTLSGATLDIVRRHLGHCPVAVGRSHGRVLSSSAYRLPSATLRAGRTTSLLRRSPYLAIPSNSSATPHENPGTTSPPSSMSVSRSHRTGELLATIITVRRAGSTTQISGVPHAR